MRLSNSLENKTHWDTCWRVELLCKKVQVPSSCEPPLEYNQDQIPLKGDMDIWSYGNMQFEMQMQKATPLGHWIEEALQIYLWWEQYWQFTKSPKSQVSGKWLTVLFYQYMQVWRLQKPFYNNYWPVWTLLYIQRIYLFGTYKKVICMNYGSSTSSWEPWRCVRLDLILLMRGIYTSIPTKLTHKIHEHQWKHWV